MAKYEQNGWTAASTNAGYSIQCKPTNQALKFMYVFTYYLYSNGQKKVKKLL